MLEFDHITYTDQQTLHDNTNTRLWFIAKQKPSNSYEFCADRELSCYWQNSVVLNCKYAAHIHKRIDEAVKRLYE